jgi:hypothetical protein
MMMMLLLSTASFAEQTSTSDVNWVSLKEAWANYINYPSSDNARRVSSLLPTEHHVPIVDETAVNTNPKNTPQKVTRIFSFL